jgi:hypothetical protein
MRRAMCTAAGVSMALVALGSAVPADATGTRSGHPPTRGSLFPVVASRLDNPRQLNFNNKGKLYIAEAGSGGTKNCVPGGEPGSQVCWGSTGSVTAVANGEQKRVITGLPSYAAKDTGKSALGPADVVPLGGGELAVTIGFGLDPSLRTGLSHPANLFGEVLRLDLHGHIGLIGDVLGYEGKHNPIHDPDSDPTGVFKWHGKFYVTDSGGNDLVKARDGLVQVVKVFHDEKTAQGKVQSVPTDVVVGPDKALYVCELTGVPFVKGASKIYRIAPGSKKATVYANHLTNVTSMAFGKDGRLYAVQISNHGLATDPNGALWRVAPKNSHKKSKNVSGALVAPYGVAIKGKSAFVTVDSTLPGQGQVLKIPLG